MKMKSAALAVLITAALASAPLSPASAHEYYHHHHGLPIIGGLFAAAGAVAVGAAEIATAPVRVIASAAEPYPAAPVYYAAPPAPVTYAYPPYGYPAAPVVYAYPPAYGYYR